MSTITPSTTCLPNLGNLTLVSGGIKKFTPYGNFDGQDENPRSFETSFIGLEKNLHIGNQSLFKLYNKNFTKLELYKQQIERNSEVIERLEREGLDQTVPYLDEVNELIEQASERRTEELSKKIVGDIKEKLGDQRVHLIDKITSIFSTNAFTALNAVFQNNSKDHYIASFGSRVKQSCKLLIPEDVNQPIQVIANYQTTYRQRITSTGVEDLQKPVTVLNKAIYTINKDGIAGQAFLNIFQ